MARSPLQVDANHLDLHMFRLIGEVEAFAKAVRSEVLMDFARQISAHRPVVRKYMHPKDQEETQ